MKKDLIKIEKIPNLPDKWDYKESVKRVKGFVYKWKNLTLEMANELWIAREILSAQGLRDKSPKVRTWSDYCEDIGSERRTVNRWLQRYFIQPQIEKPDTPELPKGKYQVIYADPPWDYPLAKSRKRVDEHYPTMKLEELTIMGERIKNISADNCVLFLWATSGRLDWAFPVIKAWGFEYKSSMVWDKIKYNMGYYSSIRHEFLLIAGRGKSTPTTNAKTINSIDSVQSIEKSTRHSEKPQEFRKIIETLYPNTKKIELFAREKTESWDSWGLEV